MSDTYLRRVRDPNPMLEQLAAQALDALERKYGLDVRPAFPALVAVAREFGAPLSYVLDERERRVRERKGPQ